MDQDRAIEFWRKPPTVRRPPFPTASFSATTTRQAPTEINRSLEGCSQLHWLGGYGELLKGQSEFASSLRIWFRSNVLGQPGSPLPIATEQEQAFTEALRNFRLSGPLQK